MKNQEFITNSLEETQKLGEEFSKNLKSGEVLALHGELGSGKTTFVQGLAKGLGIKRRIISPTFIIVRTYKIKCKVQSASWRTKFKIIIKNSKFFYHIDLYRIEDQQNIEELGIKEIMNDSQNIVVIEWAEKMGKLLPEDRVDIHFENLGEERRKIKVIC